MKIENFDTEKEVLVIAEIGNNHEGSYSLAEEMIGLAKESGAGAVKFQTYKTELFISKKNAERFNKLKSFELTFNEFEKLSKYANDAGILFMSTPFDLESAKFLKEIVSCMKISSSDNNFYPLIEEVAKAEKPIIMSTGLLNLNQIKFSVSLIYKIWDELNVDLDLAILHCVAAYPVLTKDANLLSIPKLKDEFDCTVGYSDHTLGIDASIFSVAMGARIVEKHFTVDNNYSNFRDHQLSADPKTFKELVNKIREVEVLMGKYDKSVGVEEKAYDLPLRRTIVAKSALSKNTVIGWDHISWTRPKEGLQPGCENMVLGKTLKQSLAPGDPITLDVIE